MSTELKTNFDLENKTDPPRRRATDPGVRLNPVPAKNTLLTIIFFSAVAAAILYWIFFPPAATQAVENSRATSASPAAIAPASQPRPQD